MPDLDLPQGDTTRAHTSVRDKIKSIDELAAIVSDAQSKGEKIVLAHGVFDLVHMGHVRHLEVACREGTILIVTVTSDGFVNKGPGRPVFSEDMRAEMVAALEYVSYVGISRHPSAEPILNALKPDIYVKGSDYENPADDITGRIIAEQETVERHGGRLVLTKDITFSSSSLINRYLDVYDPPLQEHLARVRAADGKNRIFDLIERAAKLRVLVIGDAIVDEYQYVHPMGKTPKENMIATRALDRELFAGGVFAAANHVAGLCAEVEIITVLGGAESHADLVRGSLKPNVRLNALERLGSPTTRKCRYIEPGYMRKLFEVYHFDDTPLDGVLEDGLQNLIARSASNFDVVILTDFGHGLISPATIDLLQERAPFLAVNTQTNSANLGYNLITRYRRADYVCIDAPEAQLAVHDRFGDVESLISQKLPSLIDCERIIVTHGNHGCVTWNGRDVTRIPAFTKTVIDTVGAGDAFLAITAPLAALNGDLDLVGFVGNAAGAIKVGIVGHRQSIEKMALMRYITTLLK